MAFYCPACLPPTNPCLIYLTLTIKPKGVIHSHLSAALLKHGGEMAVGNSRPLYRSSATLSYLHLSFHETFDIIITIPMSGLASRQRPLAKVRLNGHVRGHYSSNSSGQGPRFCRPAAIRS